MDNFSRDFIDAGQVVFRAGDPGDCAYVIEEGCVEVLREEPAASHRVAVLAQGAMFGEVALLDRQPRTATVRALLPTRLIRIERTHVESLLQQSDPVIRYLLQLLLARFRRTRALPLDSAETAEVQDSFRPSGPVDDLHAAAVRTLTLTSDLSSAIDRNQLEAFYQPIVDMRERALVGFEALIRWRHPALGLVSPAEFVPLAEKTGVVHRIGAWVLDRAMFDWTRLRELCATDSEMRFVSVNLSAPELSGPDIVATVEAMLARHHTVPAELRVELTETIIITRVAQVSASLEKLRELGVSIALDDFGTGYAGLDYLQMLPFSSIKIDKSFIQQMARAERSYHIVKSALELARRLGLGVVAEGIEDEATAASLLEMGCRYGQGYLYGKPMPAEKVAGWLAARKA